MQATLKNFKNLRNSIHELLIDDQLNVHHIAICIYTENSLRSVDQATL